MDALVNLMLTVLRMSGWGLAAALVVMTCWLILERLRCSKTVLLLMWLVVAFRLVCPWTPSSALSLFNMEVLRGGAYPAQIAQAIETGHAGEYEDSVEGMEEFDRAVSAGIQPEETEFGFDAVYYTRDDAGNYRPALTAREVYGPVLAVVWLAGTAALLAYSLGSYLVLRRKLRFAVKDEQRPGVWYSDRIISPCVAGFFHPKIYLTFGLTGEQKEHILAHERSHLSNGDHIWKAAAWLILCVHWFNLFLWVVYRGFVYCLEVACDQRVLRRLGEEGRSDYSQTLLDLSAGRRLCPAPSPIAFGEGETKDRVKSALRYKKPLAALTGAVLVLVLLLAVVLGTGAREDLSGETIPQTGEFEIVDMTLHNLLSSLSFGAARSGRIGGQVYIMPDRFSIQDDTARSPVAYDDPIYRELELGDALPLFYSNDEAVSGAGSLDLTPYRSARGWRVYDKWEHDTGYDIYDLDGRLSVIKWFEHGSTGTVKQVDYKVELAPAGALRPEAVTWEYAPYLSSRYPAFPVAFDLDYDRLEASCWLGQLIGYDDYDYNGAGYPTGQSLTLPAGSRLYWSPAEESENWNHDAAWGTVWFTLYKGDSQVLSGTIVLSSDGRTDLGQSYSARASLSDWEHYTFAQSQDTVGGVIRPSPIEEDSLPPS